MPRLENRTRRTVVVLSELGVGLQVVTTKGRERDSQWMEWMRVDQELCVALCFVSRDMASVS